MAFPFLYEYWAFTLMNIMRAIITIKALVLFPFYSIYYFIFDNNLRHPRIEDSANKSITSNTESDTEATTSQSEKQDITLHKQYREAGRILRDISKDFVSIKLLSSKETKLSSYRPNDTLVQCYPLFSNESSENESSEREKKPAKKKEKTKGKSKWMRKSFKRKKADKEKAIEMTIENVAGPSGSQRSQRKIERDGSLEIITVTSESVFSDEVVIPKDYEEVLEKNAGKKPKQASKESVSFFGKMNSNLRSLVNSTLGYGRGKRERELVYVEPELNPQIPVPSSGRPEPDYQIPGCSSETEPNPQIPGRSSREPEPNPEIEPQLPGRSASDPLPKPQTSSRSALEHQRRRKSTPQQTPRKSDAQKKVKEGKRDHVSWHQKIFRRNIRKPVSKVEEPFDYYDYFEKINSPKSGRTVVNPQEQDISLNVSGSDSSETDEKSNPVRAETAHKASDESGRRISDGVIEYPSGVHLQVSGIAPSTLEIHYGTTSDPASIQTYSDSSASSIGEVPDAMAHVVAPDEDDSKFIELPAVTLGNLVGRVLDMKKHRLEIDVSDADIEASNATESSMDFESEDGINVKEKSLIPSVKTLGESPAKKAKLLHPTPEHEFNKNLKSEFKFSAQNIGDVVATQSSDSPKKTAEVEKSPDDSSTEFKYEQELSTSNDFDNIEDNDSESTLLLKRKSEKGHRQNK